MDKLIEEIRDYYHNHGRYPKVRVSWHFYLKQPIQVDSLYLDGLDLEMDTKDEMTENWELE